MMRHDTLRLCLHFVCACLSLVSCRAQHLLASPLVLVPGRPSPRVLRSLGFSWQQRIQGHQAAAPFASLALARLLPKFGSCLDCTVRLPTGAGSRRPRHSRSDLLPDRFFSAKLEPSLSRFLLLNLAVAACRYLGGWPPSAAHLPPGQPSVVDVTCELPRRHGNRYICLPTWDTQGAGGAA